MIITVRSIFFKEGARSQKEALGRFKGPTTKQEIDYFYSVPPMRHTEQNVWLRSKMSSALTESHPCLCRAAWMQRTGWAWRLSASSTPPSSSPPCSFLPSWSKIWAVNGPSWSAWPATCPSLSETSTLDGNESVKQWHLWLVTPLRCLPCISVFFKCIHSYWICSCLTHRRPKPKQNQLELHKYKLENSVAIRKCLHFKQGITCTTRRHTNCYPRSQHKRFFIRSNEHVCEPINSTTT